MKIVLFGDSTYETHYLNQSNPALSLYHGVTTQQALNRKLSNQLESEGHPFVVDNYARGGLTSSHAINTSTKNPTYWTDALNRNPDIIIINFGANDVGDANIDETVFKNNMRYMINEVQGKGAVAVLATCLWVDYEGGHSSTDRNAFMLLGKFSEWMIDLSEEYNLTLIDIRKRFKDTISSGVPVITDGHTYESWDLFGHNSDTYLAAWGGGTIQPPDPVYYSNIHPWLSGAHVMADEMTRTLRMYEPLLGGNPLAAGRSSGWRLGEDDSPNIPISRVIPLIKGFNQTGLIADVGDYLLLDLDEVDGNDLNPLWEIDNTDVATLDKSLGTLLIKQPGIVIISAEHGGVVTTAQIHVLVAPANLHYYADGVIEKLVLYDEPQSIRLNVGGEVKYLKLAETSSDKSSPIRVQVEGEIKAVEKD